MRKTRKQEIVRHSMEILFYEGVDRLTIKNIAKKMGFVESAIYRHYTSKREILQGIISFVDSICEEINDQVTASTASAFNKIEQYFSAWNRVYKEKPYLIPILFSKELFKSDEQFIERLKQIMDHYSRLIDSLIEEGQNRNEFPPTIDPQRLKLIITAPPILLIDTWFYSGRGFPLQEESEKLFQDVKRLLSTTCTAVE